MFNSENLKVGDVFYSVKEHNTAFHRKKIHQEIDGQDWFRYDRLFFAYELIEHKVLGILTKHLEGEWKCTDPDGDLETEYRVKSIDSTHATNSKFYFDDERTNYFVDKQEALDYIITLKAAAKEIDKT